MKMKSRILSELNGTHAVNIMKNHADSVRRDARIAVETLNKIHPRLGRALQKRAINYVIAIESLEQRMRNSLKRASDPNRTKVMDHT